MDVICNNTTIKSTYSLNFKCKHGIIVVICAWGAKLRAPATLTNYSLKIAAAQQQPQPQEQNNHNWCWVESK